MFYAGIDVAMDKHDCVVLDSGGNCVVEVFTFENSRDGFRTLEKVLQACSKNPGKIKVGLESTGHYSDNLLAFLNSIGYAPVLFMARISTAERRSLFSNIFALVLYNLAAVVLNSTDSIFISAFVGTAEVAVVGNFRLITNSVKNCIKMVISASRPSIGNMVATNGMEQQKRLFDRINFLTFWTAAFSSACLYALLNPFVGDIWFDESYKLSAIVIFSIVLNFYMSVMSFAVGTFRSTNGLFVQGWYRPAVMSVLNIALDFFMGKRWGITGIYLATSISLIATQVWYDPLVVFRHAFHMKPWPYYRDYLLYLGITAICCAACALLGNLVTIPNRILSFIIKTLITVCVPNIIIIALFFKTDGFRYSLEILKRVFNKFSKKRA